MQQFLVPQFIETENKILGPLSVRQFLELLIGSFFLFVAYKMADMSLFIVLALLDVGIVGTLAFAKVNGMPFHYFLLNVIQTFKKPKIRVWFKEVYKYDLEEKTVKVEIQKIVPTVEKKFVGSSQLAELSLMIDTGGVYKGEKLIEDNNNHNNNAK